MARRDSGGFDFDAVDEELETAPAPAPGDEAAVTEGGEGMGEGMAEGELMMEEGELDEEAAAAKSDALPEADVPSPEDQKRRRPVTLYRHWVRPKFLQYRYMYDYRTNYYNDVIEYLDKRAKGEKCEIPRAQTWAERVLRTHTNPSVLDYYKNQKKEDKHLIQTIAASIKTHNYRTKAYINQRYASVL